MRIAVAAMTLAAALVFSAAPALAEGDHHDHGPDLDLDGIPDLVLPEVPDVEDPDLEVAPDAEPVAGPTDELKRDVTRQLAHAKRILSHQLNEARHAADDASRTVGSTLDELLPPEPAEAGPVGPEVDPGYVFESVGLPNLVGPIEADPGTVELPPVVGLIPEDPATTPGTDPEPILALLPDTDDPSLTTLPDAGEAGVEVPEDIAVPDAPGAPSLDTAPDLSGLPLEAVPEAGAPDDAPALVVLPDLAALTALLPDL